VTIDERLEKLVERHEALTQSMELMEERQIAAEERHEREMADIRREGDRMRTDMRRAFAMGVREARNERRRRRELDQKINQANSTLDEKITQLAAAQLITEEKLQAFLESMRRGGNGNPPNPQGQ
jgi:uncharacterized protein Yka (UPF0111/DUF47 family)